MLRISNVAPATDQEWDDAFEGSATASFFHSRAWADIWHRYEPQVWTPDPWRVDFTDGATAILPLTYRVTRSRAKVYLSSPAGTYGGWISADQIESSHARQLCGLMLERLPDVVWRLNPYDPALNNLPISEWRVDFTHVVDIAQDMHDVVASWSKGGRSAARKALRSGLVVREASGDADWRAYFHLYEESLDRWGASATSRYRWGLFDAIRSIAVSQSKLWLAELDGSVLSGAICFYAGSRIAYWHGASTRARSSVRPSNGLLFEVMRHGHLDGYELFDLCPSGGHEGVERFKHGFGAAVLPSPVIMRLSRRSQMACYLKRLVRRQYGDRPSASR